MANRWSYRSAPREPCLCVATASVRVRVPSSVAGLRRTWFSLRPRSNDNKATSPLWSKFRQPCSLIRAPPKRLTQRFKRETKGAPPLPISIRAPRRENLCRGCGKTISDGCANCTRSAVGDATKNMLDAARIGRETANGLEAQVKRANTQRKNALAQHAWKPSDQPAWLTEKFYSEKVQPLLSAVSASAIARQISVSRWYAGCIREGYRPHPRHWQKLGELAGVSADDKL